MPKKPTVKFDWFPEEGTTICTIDNKFIGTARCHPDDYDMKNRHTGEELAYNRALIKSLKAEKQNRIQPSLKALRQLYFSINNSKRFNEKSYEAIMLRRQIENWEFELSIIEDAIDTINEYIKYYITEKDNYYKHIRNKRNKVKS